MAGSAPTEAPKPEVMRPKPEVMRPKPEVMRPKPPTKDTYGLAKLIAKHSRGEGAPAGVVAIPLYPGTWCCWGDAPPAIEEVRGSLPSRRRAGPRRCMHA
jgi:hypothetical protein